MFSKKKMKDILSDNNSLSNYLQYKARNHSSYKCYSRFDRVNNIITENSIFLSTGDNWNDKQDREAFNAQELDVINYGLCFSFSKSENVAMWMLYGGTNKEGLMIDFRRNNIVKLVDNKRAIELGNFVNGKFVKEIELQPNEYEINIIDIVYYGKINNSKKEESIKRSDERVDNVPEEYLKSQKVFYKSYPWAYENECRLIVSVSKDKNISEFKEMRIPMGDDFKKSKDKRIYYSPNFDGIGEKQIMNTRINKSELAAELDWDLCSKCKKIRKE